MTPSIELDAVHVGYGKTDTLREVTCAMNAGETWAICGPNGSGKSTLLRVMAGLLFPRQGTVRLLGEAIASLDRGRIARSLAYVPQDAEIAFDFTAREVVAMGRAPHGASWRGEDTNDAKIVAREIERFALENLADRAVEALSGGERKRVALARALAQEPKVLLLDEPTASLDVKNEARLYGIVRELAETAGVTVVMVLHDFAAAQRAASHAMLLGEGQVVATGEAGATLSHERLAALFDVELETREVLVPRVVPRPGLPTVPK